MNSVTKQVNVKAEAIQAEAKAVEKRKENNRNGGKGGHIIHQKQSRGPNTSTFVKLVTIIKNKNNLRRHYAYGGFLVSTTQLF